MKPLMNELSQGFISALTLFGIGERVSINTGLPDMSKLIFVNCGYYTGNIGEGTNYLSDTTYCTVFSSCFAYIPKNGGIVMLGSYQLVDWEDDSGATPRAMLRITADEQLIFEGEITDYFSDTTVTEVSAFSYEKTFKIEAKRLNLTNNMALELYQTMIIGYD